jgi:hypothetical protein
VARNERRGPGAARFGRNDGMRPIAYNSGATMYPPLIMTDPRAIRISATLLLLIMSGFGLLGCSSQSCADRQKAYDGLLSSARQCTVGAPGQCGVQVAAGFVCGCTTNVNVRADELGAMFDEYRASCPQSVCNGICLQPRAFTCQADPTSATGGRCKPQALLELTAAQNGGSFSVEIGSEIDIVLQDVGSAKYATQVMLSSDAATVLEITIPASAPDLAGLMHLYRIGAVSPGSVVVQIPWISATNDASAAAFMVTLDIH